MTDFLQQWGEAAYTSVGFFWMALWAFVLGYIVSSLIQVFVTRARMRSAMGDDGMKPMALGTFFGFISSSCSFAALSTTRALFQKGAALAPTMAFMLASTNLVIELGFVIAIFLSWQFVVAEYVGGILLILLAWVFIKVTRPDKLTQGARDKLEDDSDDEHDHDHGDKNSDDDHWMARLQQSDTWQKVGNKYVMEWQMVWQDVLLGFTVAGIISAFVPSAFFEWLFVGVGTEQSANPGFLAVLQQAVVGPVAAFFTFIGSMGNIPLAAVLFGEGVAFAGVMAFIFSDLVVLPVIRINARYYGWKMALYITGMLFVCLVGAAIIMHYGLVALDMLPDPSAWSSPAEQQHFQLNYGFVLNIILLLLSAPLIYMWWKQRQGHEHHDHDHGGGSSWKDKLMNSLSLIAVIWLTGGLLSHAFA
ncbi:hypothetical protein SAMN06297229_1195 [Pseudidiomarina planktonica]|uniref:Permease n=1 Tax=Pseudidiomarina planktonica TaxID=1323738 RepID=A0A1Y6EV72_9GAMM|nr:permease [Pseudidiomarina planktonica]RUO65403.1 permease [Pseudidiomarina planktonica]SMQ65151.1 hypothetical protein SAMN06297229_1195 [Pseudidiomarina planktonica]